MTSYKAHCVNGVFEKNVIVNVDDRLTYCPHGQCGVRFERYNNKEDEPINVISLISYESTVLILNKNKRVLVIDGECIDALATCTVTTRKHVAAFLKEYVPNISYHDIKQALANNECVMQW